MQHRLSWEQEKVEAMWPLESQGLPGVPELQFLNVFYYSSDKPERSFESWNPCCGMREYRMAP